jgi:hypothetical protein
VSRVRRTRVAGLAREIRAVDPGTWDRAAIVAAMRDWAALFGRAPRAHEWSSTGMGPGPGSSRWLAEHPRWPGAGTVVYHFGTWSDGLRDAGLPTRITEHDLPRRERVATALALRAAGESVRSIAAQLGVHLRTALRYLAAGTCAGCGGPVLSGGAAWTAPREVARPPVARRSSRRLRRGTPSTARRRANQTGPTPRRAGVRRGRASPAPAPRCACSAPGTPHWSPHNCRLAATPGRERRHSSGSPPGRGNTAARRPLPRPAPIPSSPA